MAFSPLPGGFNPTGGFNPPGGFGPSPSPQSFSPQSAPTPDFGSPLGGLPQFPPVTQLGGGGGSSFGLPNGGGASLGGLPQFPPSTPSQFPTPQPSPLGGFPGTSSPFPPTQPGSPFGMPGGAPSPFGPGGPTFNAYA